VVDNGGGFAHPDGRVRVVNPAENLGVARSWNLLHKLAGRLPLILSNDDIRFHPESCAAALACPAPFVALEGWACFLQRDACWRRIGEYDEAFWPAYFEDNDYHHRMRVAGLPPVVNHPPAAVVHAGSATIAALPPADRAAVGYGFERNRVYYVRKWGGMPDRERFTVPFDGRPDPETPA